MEEPGSSLQVLLDDDGSIFSEAEPRCTIHAGEATPPKRCADFFPDQDLEDPYVTDASSSDESNTADS